MSAAMTRTKTPQTVVASERGKPCPRIERDAAVRADKAVHAPGAGDALLETEIGTIAPGWRVAPLENVCEPPQYGYTASASDKGNVRFLRITDIKDSGVKWSTVPFCDCPPTLANKYRLVSGDIVFARIGATTGKSYIITDPPPSVFASYLIRVQTKPEMDPFFLSQYFRSSAYWHQVDAQKKTNLKMGVNGSWLKALIVPVPPLAEQRKIAGVLGLVQRAVEQQERLIALTTELKKALLHQLFTQGLRGEPQKQTEIGPVPQSWEVVTLGSLAKVGNGSTPKRGNEGYWQGGAIPWLNSTKIHERFITEADQFVTDLAVKECHLPRVKPGSLLIAITGQGKTLGNSALVSFETCINQHLAYAQFISPKMVPEFVLWFMQTRYEHLRSISQAGGSTKGALTCGYLKTYPIPVPSLDEQREIVGVFAALDRKEKVHERKHVALTALFRTLLHELMTARIRVNNLDIDASWVEA
jgi:type I restriction enzyme S subunit